MIKMTSYSMGKHRIVKKKKKLCKKGVDFWGKNLDGYFGLSINLRSINCVSVKLKP